MHLKKIKVLCNWTVKIWNEEKKKLIAQKQDLYKKTAISPQLCELRNMITIAYMVTRSASTRKESRGFTNKRFVVNL